MRNKEMNKPEPNICKQDASFLTWTLIPQPSPSLIFSLYKIVRFVAVDKAIFLWWHFDKEFQELQALSFHDCSLLSGSQKNGFSGYNLALIHLASNIGLPNVASIAKVVGMHPLATREMFFGFNPPKQSPFKNKYFTSSFIREVPTNTRRFWGTKGRPMNFLKGNLQQTLEGQPIEDLT